VVSALPEATFVPKFKQADAVIIAMQALHKQLAQIVSPVRDWILNFARSAAAWPAGMQAQCTLQCAHAPSCPPTGCGQQLNQHLEQHSARHVQCRRRYVLDDW
jgi:hypothetical protein